MSQKLLPTIRSSSSSPLASYLQDLIRRNLLANSLPTFPYNDQDISAYASTLPDVLYSGFDPTSSSLHIGNLVVLGSLLRSSLFGCTPIVLIGEATALVGDPAGHTTVFKQSSVFELLGKRKILEKLLIFFFDGWLILFEFSDRPQFSRELINENTKSLERQVKRIAEHASHLHGRKIAVNVLNNIDWYKEMNVLDFFESAKRFRVNDMLRSGPLKVRVDEGTPLSYAEFSYQNMQAIDWLQLAKKHKCLCQIGGTDQLGNLKAGFELF